MSRRFLTFACHGSTLAATIDEAPGTTGLLIVTGGNEVRAGAWNGQAQLAARLASAGHPVMRFDRRGVGDSEGENVGFRSSGPDIAAALAAFRAACPQLVRVIGHGNCDAASALMLSQGAGLDGLALANPWTFDDATDSEQFAAPPAAIRDHYRRRLTDLGALRRLFTGQVSLVRLFGSLRRAAAPPPPPSGLIGAMQAGLAGYSAPVRFLVAARDRTGQAFLAGWGKDDSRIRRCHGAGHSFVEAEAQAWLTAQLLDMLRSA